MYKDMMKLTPKQHLKEHGTKVTTMKTLQQASQENAKTQQRRLMKTNVDGSGVCTYCVVLITCMFFGLWDWIVLDVAGQKKLKQPTMMSDVVLNGKLYIQ